MTPEQRAIIDAAVKWREERTLLTRLAVAYAVDAYLAARDRKNTIRQLAEIAMGRAAMERDAANAEYEQRGEGHP